MLGEENLKTRIEEDIIKEEIAIEKESDLNKKEERIRHLKELKEMSLQVGQFESIFQSVSNDKKVEGREIERKFLVNRLPEKLDSYPHKEITQGYVKITADMEERVRQKGDKYVRTIKTGSGENRGEKEWSINKEEFEEGIKIAGDRIVKKTRYNIPYKDKTIELDIYHGKLDGLLTAEVEFNNSEEARNFEPPEWFGKEVTEDKRYKNQSLAVHGLPF